MWRQSVDGVPASDRSLRVNLSADGRVLNVLGAPAQSLDVGTTPALTAGEAVRAVQDDVGVHRPLVRRGGTARRVSYGDDTSARLVTFSGRLAWRVQYRAGDDAVYDATVDARSGAVLRRANMVKSEAPALVWERFPGSGPGGAAVAVDLEARGYLPAGASTLAGPYVRAYSDLDDDDVADAGEEVGPGFTFPLVPGSGNGCDAGHVCSWTGSGSTWAANREQDTVQAFYLANRFRDHLATLGFDGFEGADRVVVNTLDGAASGPDGDHVNNANMFTPPDGESPLMQMYLWRSPYRNVSSGSDAAILYHEYTHGLSNRLVVDADGVGALNTPQAGAMGEGWSDWYAQDFLVGQFGDLDTGAAGEVDMGAYADAGASRLRTSPLDCPVGASSVACPGRGAAGSGGYTYGDFGRIFGSAEVHYDGEIWAQTLWDVRTALGFAKARALVTAGMRLLPPEPSFLDARNGILLADQALYAGADAATLWDVFAARGMGFFAASMGGEDTAPAEDFSLPPGPEAPKGTISGRVTAVLGGGPVAGVTIGLGGVTGFAATTDADGRFTLGGVPEGTYPKVSAGGAGWDAEFSDLTVSRRRHDHLQPGAAPQLGVRARRRDGHRLQRPRVHQQRLRAVRRARPVARHDLVHAGRGREVPDPAAARDDRRDPVRARPRRGLRRHGRVRDRRLPDRDVARRRGLGDRPPGRVHERRPASAQLRHAFGRCDRRPLRAALTALLPGLRRTVPRPVRVRRLRHDRRRGHDRPGDDAGGGRPAVHVLVERAGDVRVQGRRRPSWRRARRRSRRRWRMANTPSRSGPSTPRATVTRRPRSRTFTVDTTAPETGFVGPHPALTNNTTPTFTFASSPPGATFECSLDEAPFAACTSPYTTGELADGRYTFAVRAITGRPDPTPAVLTFRIDATAPETTIGSGPSGPVHSGPIAFGVGANEDATFECALDDGDFGPCSAAYRAEDLALGEHVYRARATDQAGNVDATPAERVFVVVNAAPVATLAFDQRVRAGAAHAHRHDRRDRRGRRPAVLRARLRRRPADHRDTAGRRDHAPLRRARHVHGPADRPRRPDLHDDGGDRDGDHAAARAGPLAAAQRHRRPARHVRPGPRPRLHGHAHRDDDRQRHADRERPRHLARLPAERHDRARPAAPGQERPTAPSRRSRAPSRSRTASSSGSRSPPATSCALAPTSRR